jgi:hypothetical protein
LYASVAEAFTVFPGVAADTGKTDIPKISIASTTDASIFDCLLIRLNA